GVCRGPGSGGGPAGGGAAADGAAGGPGAGSTGEVVRVPVPLAPAVPSGRNAAAVAPTMLANIAPRLPSAASSDPAVKPEQDWAIIRPSGLKVSDDSPRCCCFRTGCSDARSQTNR